jgi:hypothetical protein
MASDGGRRGHPGIAGRVQQPIGPGGWVRSIRPDGRELWVRYRLSESGRYEIAELHLLEGDSPITWETLAELKVGQLEAFANNPAVATVLAASNSTLLEGRPGEGTPSFETNEWSPFTDLEMPLVRHAARALAIDGPPGPRPKPIPRRRPHREPFYRAVADWYAWSVKAGEKPAKVIANAHGVPATTVHRWVADTRKNGYLPPARKGRAG